MRRRKEASPALFHDNDDFHLEKNIRLGMLPLVLNSPSPEETLRAYAGIYLKEEVQAEGLVAQHLKAWVDAQLNLHQLHFWRTSSGLEVDFIVTGPTLFLAIEFKNGTVIHPQDLRGLQSFSEDYPEATPILLYRGKHKYKEQNILCMPIEEFLLSINPSQPLI